MHSLTLLLGAVVVAGSLVGLLLKVAILAVVIWAVVALLRWAGITIPEPVRIILIALVCIALIYFLFEIFQAFIA